MKEIGIREYFDNFHLSSSPPDLNILKSALTEARDNRKFEIDLYWKRAAYFWVFISVAFGGYSALQGRSQTIGFLAACVGFIFSLAWYFVNRGSKFWQQNWELHVDLLEDRVSGPIYKTVVQRDKCRFFKLNGAYPFSVSKINQLLSLFISVVWLILIVRSVLIVWDHHLDIDPRRSTSAIFALTVIAAGILYCFGRTEDTDDVSIKKIYWRRRTVDQQPSNPDQ